MRCPFWFIFEIDLQAFLFEIECLESVLCEAMKTARLQSWKKNTACLYSKTHWWLSFGNFKKRKNLPCCLNFPHSVLLFLYLFISSIFILLIFCCVFFCVCSDFLPFDYIILLFGICLIYTAIYSLLYSFLCSSSPPYPKASWRSGLLL